MSVGTTPARSIPVPVARRRPPSPRATSAYVARHAADVTGKDELPPEVTADAAAERSPSRRNFLRVGAGVGAGTALGLGMLAHASAAAAATGAQTVQTTQVVVVDSADELPPGTPAGTLVVVRS